MTVTAEEKIKTLHDEVLHKLKQNFGDGIVSSTIDYDFPVFVVEQKIIHDVLKFLKEDPSQNYHFLTSMCALHYPERPGNEYGMMYQLHNMPENKRIRIKTSVPAQNLEVPTVTDLWATANWMERQEYDFFGIKFTGHPDLRRILNMEDITFFPLRKDFPLEDPTRDDKNDAMFGR